MGIPTFQIETRRIFSIASILIALRNVAFKEKFEKLIFINKWQSNPHVGCLKFFDFAFACEVELNLTKELDVEFEHEVECKFFLKA